MTERRSLAGRRPLVIAHRGASGTAPENTLAAFQMAVDVGADALELDVRLTRDCEVVVCHDETLDRTTSGYGKISEHDYDDLRWSDAGYRFTMDEGRSFPFRGQGVRIPLLAEVLQKFPTTPLIVELKENDVVLASRTVEVLRRHGRLNDGSVMITSFIHSQLRQVRQLAPGLLSGCSNLENVRLLTASTLHARRLFGRPQAAFQLPVRKFRLPITTPRVVATAHALGMEVFTYTVNDWADMRRFLDMGVDGIFTNYPHRLRIVVNSRD